MIGLKQFNELTLQLHGFSQDLLPCSHFLQSLRDLCNAEWTALTLRFPQPGDPGVAFCSGKGFTPQEVSDFANTFAPLDFFQNLPPDQVITLDEWVPRPKLREAPYFEYYLKPNDATHILAVDIDAPAGRRVHLRAMRGSASPDFQEADKDLFRLLTPHLTQLFCLQSQIHSRELERTNYEDAVSRVGLGTIILNKRLQMIHCNPVARYILDTHDGLTEAQGRLYATQNKCNDTLQTLLCGAAAHISPERSLVKALTLRRKNHNSYLYLVVRSFDTTSTLLGSTGHIAVHLSAPELRQLSEIESIRELLGLTPSEARLAILLANGHTLAEASLKVGVSKNTLRSQLKALFAKTGVCHQAPLVSLILRSISGLAAPR